MKELTIDQLIALIAATRPFMKYMGADNVARIGYATEAQEKLYFQGCLELHTRIGLLP